MQSVMRTLLCAAAAITVSLLTACGSGSGTTTPATIRVVNDTTAPNVTLSLNGLATVSAATQVTSGYASVTPSTYTLSVATPTGLTGAASSVGLGTAQNYTALAYERGNNIYSAVYSDNQATPSTGFSSLDVANVSSDAGPLDIYLVPHSAGTPSLTGYQPTFSSVQGLSTATTLASTAPASGSTAAIAWDIVVTKAAAPNDVRLTLSNPNFVSAQPYTLVLTATAGGGLVNSVLIPQGLTTAVFTPSSQARVRVWSALPIASAIPVTVQVGTTTLSVANAPSPTPYQLVPALSTVTAISLNGSPIATLPTGSFAAGGDYTILIYGAGTPSSGVAAALILTDNNQVVANYASVRLINAAVPGSGGLTMYVANAEGASSVTYPTASTGTAAYVYTGVKPASAAPINLIGSGYTGAQSNGQFTSGSVYTAMVYDAALPPLIVQDR